MLADRGGWRLPKSCAIKQQTEARSRVPPHLRRHMGVELKCRLNRVVAEALAHRFDINAFLKKEWAALLDPMAPDPPRHCL